MRRTLADWGFDTPREASRESREYVPVNRARNLVQVQELLAEGITADQLLNHPFIELTIEAKVYLEGLET
jgi:hypothetical protein